MRCQSVLLTSLFIFGTLIAGAQPTTILSVKNMAIGIDIATGGRITSLTVDGTELLGSSRIHPRFYGSSLWLSPENKWKGMGLLDAGTYKIEHSGPGDLLISSADDTVRGFAFTKEFRVNGADTSVFIRYTISNTAKAEQEVAPWEVTRVPTGGLAFFPSGPLPALAKSDLIVRDSAGLTWYPYDSVSRTHQKLFRHGAEGWTAYVRGATLFIKQYPVMPPGQAAPGEENVEMYVNPEKTYIELENQGPYQRLSPGSSLGYEVKWYARRLPAGLQAITGDKALTAYIRNFISAHPFNYANNGK
jgi:Domain of unknown function (DUF4380)